MKVDFFIAGTQKAGTTALDAYLRRHPSIRMARRKEPHHFDNETLDWTRPDHHHLHTEFDHADQGALRGEATPVYTFWPPAIPRICGYNPAARLIVLFRDPIERAYSHWRMEVTRRAETLSFSDAIRTGRTRLDPATPLSPAWRTFSYVERGAYEEQVRRMLDAFPRESLLFLKSDDLSADPTTTLAVVSRFLGIDPLQSVDPITEHAGSRAFGPISPKDIEHLRSLFRDELLEFATLTGLNVSDWPTLNPKTPVR